MSKAAHGVYAASITPIDPASGQPSGERLIQHSQWLMDQGMTGVAPLGTTGDCLLYTSPSPRDRTRSRMPSSA